MNDNVPTRQQRYTNLIEWARRTLTYARAVNSPEFSDETLDLVLEMEAPHAEAALKAIRDDIRQRRGDTLAFAAAAAELIPAVMNVVRKPHPAAH